MVNRLIGLIIMITMVNQVQSQNLSNSYFDNWKTDTLYTDLNGWMTTKSEVGSFGDSLVKQMTDAYSGQYALRLTTQESFGDTLPSFAILGEVAMSGGIPRGGDSFPYFVDSLMLFAKFNIQPTDSAVIIVILKNGGNIFDYKTYYLSGQQPNYTRYAFDLNPLNFPADSVIFGIASSNVFKSKYIPGSWIQVDSVHFRGATGFIANHSFENWYPVSVTIPDEWFTTEVYFYPDTTISRFFDGANSVLRMVNYEGNPTTLSKGLVTDSIIHGVAFSYYPTELAFKYKYEAFDNLDTAEVVANFFTNGSSVGNHTFHLSDTNNFVKFSGGLNLSMIPDSMQLYFKTGLLSSSVLYLDSIAFTQNLTTELPELTLQANILLYPNPAIDYLIISTQSIDFTNVQIYDIQGNLLLSHNTTKTNSYQLNLNSGYFSSGNYIIRLFNETESVSSKFLIE